MTLLGLETFPRFLGKILKGIVTLTRLRGVPVRTVRNSKEQLDLDRLRARLREKPRTKAGQVRQAWPHIRELLAVGHSLKDVWAWLNEIGLEIGYARLSHYIGQLRRQDETAQPETRESKTKPSEGVTAAVTQIMPTSGRTVDPLAGSDAKERDPLANILEREGKRAGFNYNEEPDPKKLI